MGENKILAGISKINAGEIARKTKNAFRWLIKSNHYKKAII